MNDSQRQYYEDMLARGRGVLILRDGHVVAIVTFFIGDDDEKFLTNHRAWTMLDDNACGETVYIDQMIGFKGRPTHKFIHTEFTNLLKELKTKFPNIKQVKWVRVGAQFRKHGKIEGVTNGRRIHHKDIKF